MLANLTLAHSCSNTSRVQQDCNSQLGDDYTSRAQRAQTPPAAVTSSEAPAARSLDPPGQIVAMNQYMPVPQHPLMAVKSHLVQLLLNHHLHRCWLQLFSSCCHTTLIHLVRLWAPQLDHHRRTHCWTTATNPPVTVLRQLVQLLLPRVPYSPALGLASSSWAQVLLCQPAAPPCRPWCRPRLAPCR